MNALRDICGLDDAWVDDCCLLARAFRTAVSNVSRTVASSFSVTSLNGSGAEVARLSTIGTVWMCNADGGDRDVSKRRANVGRTTPKAAAPNGKGNIREKANGLFGRTYVTLQALQ